MICFYSSFEAPIGRESMRPVGRFFFPGDGERLSRLSSYVIVVIWDAGCGKKESSCKGINGITEARLLTVKKDSQSYRVLVIP